MSSKTYFFIGSNNKEIKLTFRINTIFFSRLKVSFIERRKATKEVESLQLTGIDIRFFFGRAERMHVGRSRHKEIESCLHRIRR